MINVIMIMG